MWKNHLFGLEEMVYGGLMSKLDDRRNELLRNLRNECDPWSTVTDWNKAKYLARKSWDAAVKELQPVIEASIDLRIAQKYYMENRGNDVLGKVVAEKAKILDEALENIK